MTPRSRFAVYEDTRTPFWYVFDQLRGYHIRSDLVYAVAFSIARSEEASWRERCERWIEAEWRDDLR
jgi:hypothetical protein